MSPEEELLKEQEVPEEDDFEDIKPPKLKVDASAEEGTFEGFASPNPLAPDEYEDAFQKVYKLAGLDPEQYRIVEDTVRFSVWQQSAKPKGAKKRDLVTLYSYRARFRRVSAVDRKTEKLVAELAESARKRRKLAKRTPGTGLGPPCSYTALPSDWQFGKNEVREQDLAHGATGVEQTTWRIERFLDSSAKRIKDLRRLGRNIESVSIGFMGDPTENIADSYPNQTHIIELNLNDQIMRALDMMTLVCEELLPLSQEDPNVFAVLCNHGQLARRGTKTNVTDDADNVQNLLMSLLRNRIIGPSFPGTNWYLPEEKMITTLDIAGIPVASAHGHKIPSGANGEAKWLSAQTAALADKRGFKPKLWLTAHRHSHDAKDYGPYHRLQAATADGGSKHFEDGTGTYSTPGTSVLVIGPHNERGFTDWELL